MDRRVGKVPAILAQPAKFADATVANWLSDRDATRKYRRLVANGPLVP